MFAAGTAMAVALGFWAAHALRWYCDDIFITLRYADQFLAGHGFVYNVGERVEGYTHFLWLVILTTARALGLDPLAASMNLGMLSYACTIGAAAFVSYRMAGRSVVVPFAALALAANTECNIWATSGLETFFFTFLLALAFVVYFFLGAREGVRLVVAALCLVLAAMTRPDGLLFYAVAGVFVAARAVTGPARAARAGRDVALFAAPLVLVYLPYVAWKVSYYGDFFPNTYYAKSASLPYYSQGFYFLWTYLRGHPTSALFVLALPFLAAAWRRRAVEATAHERRSDAAALVALTAVAVYLVGFVARVGGDFMYARFVVPALPFVYFLVEWSAGRAMPARPVARALVLVMIVAGIATAERGLRNALLFETVGGTIALEDRRGIVDERFYYTEAYPLASDRRVGELLRPYFEGLDATVVLRGQACLGYFAAFATCIENSGLTDATIAHQRLQTRGRIGHEKSPSYEYLVERGANFTFSRRPYRERAYRIVNFMLSGGVRVSADMITYDRALMAQLRRRMGRDISFVPFEDYLDRYMSEAMDGRTAADLARDYAEFKEFYFAHNEDPERERPFLERMEAR